MILFIDILYKIQRECKSNIIPLKVSYITNDKSLGGKFPEETKNWNVAMDFKYFINLFIDNLPPVILNEINKYKDDDLQKNIE